MSSPILVDKGAKFYDMYVIILNFIAKNILFLSELQDFKLYEDYSPGDKEIKLSGDIKVNNVNVRVKINIVVAGSSISFNGLRENGISYTAYFRANSKEDINFYTEDKNKPALSIEHNRVIENFYYDLKINTAYERIENYDGGNQIVTKTKYITDNKYYDREQTKTLKKLKEISYFKNSKLNNKPGEPAVISTSGSWSLKKYYKDGLPHRDSEKGKNKPAYIETFNKKPVLEKYFINGDMNRADKPAYIEYNKGEPIKMMWYSNNVLSNSSGPAYVEKYPGGNVKIEQYFLFGALHRENGPAIVFYDQNGKRLKEEYYLEGVKIDKVTDQICGSEIKSGIIFNLNIDRVKFCLNCNDVYTFLTESFQKIKETQPQTTDEEFQTFLTTIATNDLNVLKKEYNLYFNFLKIMYENWIQINKDIIRIKSGDDVEMLSSDELTKRLKQRVTVSKFKNLIQAYIKAKIPNDLCNINNVKIIEITDNFSNIDYGKYLNSSKNSSTSSKITFKSGLCQGIVNNRGVCWANALIQFISPISDNIKFKDTESVIDKYCPMKKGRYSGGSDADHLEFFKNIQKKININKKIIDIVYFDSINKLNITSGDSKYTIFFRMNINDILIATNGKIAAGLSFNVKMMQEINATHIIKSIFVVIPGHAICIRFCQDKFYVFDDDNVIFIPYDLIELINNKSLFIKLSDRYKHVQPHEIVFHSYLFEKLTT